MSNEEAERLRRWQASRIANSQSQNYDKSDFDSQWLYKSTSSRKAIPLPFQQLQRILELKFNYRSRGGDKLTTQDIELNGDLIGVKLAMGVLRPYELCVGIELPSLNATNRRVRDISREVDQEAVALNHKKWRELMEELSRPVDDLRNSGVGSNGDAAADKSTVDNNLSLLPGLDLASWGDRRTSLPSTPKPKLRPLVIFGPRGGTRSCTLTPCAGDSDAAASPSLSPSEIAAELSEMKRSPTPPLSLSFSSESTDSSPKSIAASPSPSPSPDFVFPSLTARPVPRKIHLEKDDQGFFIGFEDVHYHHSIDTSGLLPPFLIEETPKRKMNQSKTRSIVDRLKRRTPSEEVPILHPLPQSQSQSRSTPQGRNVEEGDRWIGLGFGEPYQPDHSRAEKKRESFLATNKQQHPSEENNHQKPKKKDATPSVTRSSRPPISAPSNPNNDGWIEYKQPPQQPPRQHTTRSRSQNNKRHSHSNSSVSHPPSQLPPPPQTAPAAYTTFRPPPLPSHPQPQLQPQQPQPQPQLQLQPQPHHPQAYYYPYSYPQHQYAAVYSQVQPQPQPHPYATTYPMALPTVPMAPVAVPVPVPGTLMPGTTTVAKHPGYPGFMNRPPIVGYPSAW
ncbi:hypothetical protein L218DRAFT_163822 [Marasmius fiardii PR-910]|nr:hypothetical protein L218DRAFT_163822 [Marasmius fiardii PR-910]